MEEKFYTIDQIAELLGMHHKTIRKFINESKIRATKVGKQWRITGHDLSVFMEDNKVNVVDKKTTEQDTIEFSTKERGVMPSTKVSISTVVDLQDIDMDDYRRVSNMLLAVMNSNDAIMKHSTINLKHYQKENSLKILLWGYLRFTQEMLGFISTLVESNSEII